MLSAYSESYSQARQMFLAVCENRKLEYFSVINPNLGPDGEELAVDVALLGDPAAENILYVTSGVHGVEGYFGSAVLIGQLSSGFMPPKGVRCVLVHAVNPWGFAHCRRFTEENVDLNRNFWVERNFSAENKQYSLVKDWAEIADLSEQAIETAETTGKQLVEDIGIPRMKIALAGGQDINPQGLFFVGHGATWARVAFEYIVYRTLGQIKIAFHMDLHTGLGPTGYADILSHYAENDERLETLVTYLGEAASSQRRITEIGQELRGALGDGLNRILSRRNVNFLGVSIEVGTQELYLSLDALRYECALHFDQNPTHPRAATIKQNLRDAFYVTTDAWKSMAYDQTDEYLRGAIRYLSDQ